MLDAEYAAERRLQPALRQPGRVTARIGWIGERDVVIERAQSFRKRQSRLSVDGDQITGGESINILLQGADALRILLHEIGAERSARQGFESERARAGVEIQHARAGQVELKDAHPGLT